MNEPNTQQDQTASPPTKKMSSRATNFLMMNAGVPGSDATENQPPPEAPPQPPPPPEQPAPRRTGVVGSTIHPAQRPGNIPPDEPEPQQNSASRTSQLASASRGRTSQPIDPETKARIQEEKIDKIADRITDVLKRINDFRTGMLNPDMQTGEKLHLMAGGSPGMMKFLAILLTQLEPMIKLVQRINEKLVEKNVMRGRAPARGQADEELPPEDLTPPPPEKVSFIELAEKNIIFCDNRKRPLYSLEQMRGKHGYTASEEVLAPMILQNIVEAFHEVAPKARAIPTPTAGIYANIPMDQVMENISDEEIMRFLNYVQRFPRGYVGKNFRITESFAGWVVSGTPDD